MLVLSERLSIQSRLSTHVKTKHQQHTTLHSVNHSDSGGLKSRLELTGFSWMYQKSSQKSSTDEYYPESSNSFSKVQENFTQKYINFTVKQKFIKLSIITAA